MKKAGYLTTAFATLLLLSSNDLKGQTLASNYNDKANTEVKAKRAYSVGIKNMMKASPEYAERMAKDISALRGGGIVFVYSGTNGDLLDKVRAGASTARDAGIPVRGIIQTKSDPSFTEGSDSFYVCVKGGRGTGSFDATISPEDIAEDVAISMNSKWLAVIKTDQGYSPAVAVN